MFRDVSKDHIFADDIDYVSRTGVMVGYPDGTFRPDQPITRGEVAAIVHRMMLHNGVFDDVLPMVLPSVVEIRTDKSLGSGVAVLYDGVLYTYILTCRHVIEGSEQMPCTVVTHDGKNLIGRYRIASSVPGEDLAVIEVSARIQPLSLGKPVVQGQPVAVIGSPLGLRESVTVGVVSSIDRHEGVWFQLDAPINPGNSGGPIVDESGKLVGIAVAKVVDAALPGVGVEGIGYGIRIDVVKRFLGRVWPNVSW